jgi:hypothetical protein
MWSGRLQSDKEGTADKIKQMYDFLNHAAPMVNSRGDKLKSLDIEIQAEYEKHKLLIPKREWLAPPTALPPPL